MSFWDSVKKFTQPYSDEEYDDYEDEDVDGYEEETPAPAPRERRHTSSYRASSFDTDDSADTGFSAPSVSSVSAAPSTGFVGQVVSSSSGATKAADDLKRHKAVILNMENVDKALTRRVVDFLTGCIYALEGDVKKIANASYLFCPSGMNIVGDLENLRSEVENYV